MRNGKITAGNPISSKNYLKKSNLAINDGMYSGFDVVLYTTAKKACQKANVEGQDEAFEKVKELLYNISRPGNKDYCIISKDVTDYITKKINQLQDQILATKI